MKFYRLATLACATAAAFSFASPARADIIEVDFSGLIFATNTPGISGGDSFSGSFTYSTIDPFEGSSGGLESYLLTAPEDSLSLSVDGSTLSLGQPLSGVTALVGLAPLTSDPNPHQDYFAVEAGSSAGTVSTSFDIPGYSFAGLSVQLVGSPTFLSSGALPDPFNASDVTLGLVPGALYNSVVSLDFTDSNGDVYYTSGDIQEISATISPVPEPRGLSLACLGIVALAFVLFRRTGA
jgi:hypothetical protein